MTGDSRRSLEALIAKWRHEAADEQRVSFCADELEAALQAVEEPPVQGETLQSIQRRLK